MASQSPSAKLVQSCHLVVAAVMDLHCVMPLDHSTGIMCPPFGVQGSRDSDPGVEMQRQVEVIGAAWGLGGADPGCADAPAALAPALTSRLQQCGVPVVPGPMLRPLSNERRKHVAVSKLCGLLGSAVAD